MAIKSFSSFNGQTKEPFEIEINGATWTFRPHLPGAMLLDFTANSDPDRGDQMAKAMEDLLDAAIIDVQRDEFRKFLRDYDTGPDMDTLGELAGYLAEKYTSRPLSPSGTSSAGPAVSGPGSMGPPGWQG